MNNLLLVSCLLTAGCFMAMVLMLRSIPRHPGDPYAEWEKRKGVRRD